MDSIQFYEDRLARLLFRDSDRAHVIIYFWIHMITSFIIGLLTLGLVYTIPTGYVGVKTSFGAIKGVEQQGMHIKAPLGIESIELLDIRVRKTDVKAEAGSKDLQTVNTDIVVNYHLNSKQADKVFSKIGGNYEVDTNILTPAVSEVVKAAVAKKTAEEILTKRPELKKDIDVELSRRLATYNIVLDDVSIVNVDFSPEFNKAIEAKQVSEQEAKQAVFKAEQAKNDAVARVNMAEGQAKAQSLQVQSLTPELLQKAAIDKWNGVLPVTMTSGTAVPFINLK